MEIWLDTSNKDLVIWATSLGILQGVTTNPTIVAASKIHPEELITTLLEVQKGLVAVQVLSQDSQEMVQEAKALFNISNRILVKIPGTQQGLQTIYALSQEGIPTLATALFEPRQALLAFRAGANYLAPYLGRIADTGKDPLQVISQMHSMKMQYDFPGKIMGAGIRDLATAEACVEMGLSAMTLSDKIFKEFTQDCEPTLLALKKFSQDWATSSFPLTSFSV